MREIVTVDSGLEIQPGKMVFELRPAGADKGHALEAFMAAPPFAGRRPLAVGDDLTDEAMFAVAVRLGGMAVRVGAKSGGRAAASLADSAAVRAWLADLAANRR